MTEPKTKATKQSVTAFINSIEPETKRNDSLILVKIFEKATGEKAVMWGSSIVGFGSYHNKSEKNKREGDWMLVAFSPRKQNLTLYIGTSTEEEKILLTKLGKYKTSGGCLHINSLSDVNEEVLAKLVKKSFDYKKKITK